MNEKKLRKVLVSSFAFNPIKGSECAVGWNYVRAIAAENEVWVLTRSLERDDIEQYQLQHPDALRNITVQYVEERFRNLNGPIGKITNYLRYKRWHWDAYQQGRILAQKIDFYLTHQLTGIGFREPGHLWRLGKPFVWGPIGGLQYFPSHLLQAVPLSVRPFYMLKNLSTAWAMHVAPKPRRAAAAATVLIASSSDIGTKIRTLWNRGSFISSEVTVPELEPVPLRRRENGEALRIAWGGNCDPRKALNIVLLALEKVNRTTLDWRLIAMGDGPLFEPWKALARDLGIADRCEFRGRVSRSEVLSIMASSHCLVQPSLYDATSTVVAEALAYGLPVVCLDHFGFKDAVNAGCGIKIAPIALDQVIEDFARAIEMLGRDESLRYSMALAAQETAENLSWRRKQEVIHKVYDQIYIAKD
jgi:glycosyltransferase involved in cell wall biosynthesis